MYQYLSGEAQGTGILLLTLPRKLPDRFPKPLFSESRQFAVASACACEGSRFRGNLRVPLRNKSQI